ncbi:PH domain-containing protein [Candidatus Parcubacteria bacterium]|nr:PH domain-containing protein [Candidatus Parcubacteria bacterium]
MLSIYRLPNQLPDEKVVKIVRKDLFIIFKKTVLVLILALIPFALFFLLLFSSPDFFKGEVVYPLIVLGLSSYYLFIWVFFFFSFIDYYLDVWIVTNKRIIDIEQLGFFSRVISEQKIVNVQDVTSETHGIIATILRFGYLYVQTAGAKQRFVFEDIPHPDAVRDLIIKLATKEKRREKRNEMKNKAQFGNL